MSDTSSGNAILQKETETIHVSMFRLVLYSQPVGLGRLIELLTSGVEHPADIFSDAGDFAFDAFEVLPLLHQLNKLLLWFPSASPATPLI